MKAVKKLSILSGALLLVLLLATASFAAGTHTVGLGFGMAPDYEGSEDYQAVPLLMLKGQYESGRSFEFLGTRLRVNLLPNQQYSLGPVLQYRAARNNVDNDTVERMNKVDAAVEAGAYAGLNIDNFIASVQAVTDISDAHDGSLVTLTGGYKFVAMPDLVLIPTLETTWASDDYMQTYFGIDSRDSSRTGLARYNADSGMKDVGIGLMVDYRPWEQWGVVGLLKYNKLLNDAKDSPLVDDLGDSGQILVGAMATYRW